MANSDEVKLNEELKWISMEERTLSGRSKSKGIFGILVPLGCVVTAGVLVTGMYHMFKRNSRKQQHFMRYRVLAQGITLALAAAGILRYRNQ